MAVSARGVIGGLVAKPFGRWVVWALAAACVLAAVLQHENYSNAVVFSIFLPAAAGCYVLNAARIRREKRLQSATDSAP
jgi:hypothetical protein